MGENNEYDPHDFFDRITMEAKNELSLIGDRMNEVEHEMNGLRAEQKRLKGVIRAASGEVAANNIKPSKAVGIRLSTRQTIMDAVRKINGDSQEFTASDLSEAAEIPHSSTLRAISVLREEGMIRKVGMQGMAPMYKWVGG
jgi:DNA-binding transcriptional ArsR family regulator